MQREISVQKDIGDATAILIPIGGIVEFTQEDGSTISVSFAKEGGLMVRKGFNDTISISPVSSNHITIK